MELIDRWFEAFLTTVTDVSGFFSFLGIATLLAATL
jgi:Mg/Co/Ni transporter MgtE